LLSSLGAASTSVSSAGEPSPAAHDEFTTASAPLRISVIGCGGCGVRFVSHLAERGIPDLPDSWRVDYFGVDTNMGALGYVNESRMETIWLPSDSCEGRPSTARAFAGYCGEWLFGYNEPDESALERNGTLRLPGTSLVIVVAGLGGGSGTGFSQLIAHRARQDGALTVATVTLPSSHEPRRIGPSGELRRLQRAADAVFAFSHDYACGNDTAISLPDRMGRCEADATQCVRNLISTLAVPGLIGFDLADMRLLLAGGGLSWYGFWPFYCDREKSDPDAFATAIIKAIRTRRDFPGFVDETHCANTLYGIPRAKRALIACSGNAETLSLKYINRGLTAARHLFGEDASCGIVARVDSTMRTGHLSAEIWLSTEPTSNAPRGSAGLRAG
jgi:cell division GTPase FtsZ